MRNFFTPKPTLVPTRTAVLLADINSTKTPVCDLDLRFIAEAAIYDSDESEDRLKELKGNEHCDTTTAPPSLENQTKASDAQLPAEPERKTASSLKRRKLEISCIEQQKAKQDARAKELRTALDDLHSLLVSKKTKFVSGPHELQARRARAMESHL